MSSKLTASPLGADQLGKLQEFTAELSSDQLLWVSGYLAGMTRGHAVAVEGAGSSAAEEVTILYASQTGNAQKVATRLQQSLAGYAVKLQDVMDYKKSRLKSEKYLFLVASTHGEGEPPDLAVEFHQFLMGKKAPKVEGLHFSVLALGDTSYAKYCQIGKEFDQRLIELGATPLVERVDCDVDYHDAADEWIAQVQAALAEQVGTQPSANVSFGGSMAATGSAYGRKNPFAAEMLENIVLNGRGSAKEVRHIELSLEGSGLVHQPGDSLGVAPQNPPDLVNKLLETLAFSGDEEVSVGGEKTTLKQAFASRVEISPLSRPVLVAYNQYAESPELSRLLEVEHSEEFQRWVYDRDLLDLVTEFPLSGLSASDFVATLRKLPARLYSIASSYAANPDEVHLTVATLRYQARGRDRLGTASAWLAGIEEGTVPVYLDENPNFRLPEDPDKDIIMIGPGTGVAPFRAFLEERSEQGAGGRNWLFFGDQHFHTDFLYQREWQGHLKSGLLSRLDLAFSRDQAEKIYVQHRMLEQGRNLFEWIDEGGSVYVCGDSSRMAPDVNDALLQIIAEQGGLSKPAAEEYLMNMQKDKRYQRDVY